MTVGLAVAATSAALSLIIAAVLLRLFTNATGGPDGLVVLAAGAAVGASFGGWWAQPVADLLLRRRPE